MGEVGGGNKEAGATTWAGEICEDCFLGSRLALHAQYSRRQAIHRHACALGLYNNSSHHVSLVHMFSTSYPWRGPGVRLGQPDVAMRIDVRAKLRRVSRQHCQDSTVLLGLISKCNRGSSRTGIICRSQAWFLTLRQWTNPQQASWVPRNWLFMLGMPGLGTV
jgi:hypothetical protein